MTFTGLMTLTGLEFSQVLPERLKMTGRSITEIEKRLMESGQQHMDPLVRV